MTVVHGQPNPHRFPLTSRRLEGDTLTLAVIGIPFRPSSDITVIIILAGQEFQRTVIVQYCLRHIYIYVYIKYRECKGKLKCGPARKFSKPQMEKLQTQSMNVGDSYLWRRVGKGESYSWVSQNIFLKLKFDYYITHLGI